jgi:hypothetical protein
MDDLIPTHMQVGARLIHAVLLVPRIRIDIPHAEIEIDRAQAIDDGGLRAPENSTGFRTGSE